MTTRRCSLFPVLVLTALFGPLLMAACNGNGDEDSPEPSTPATAPASAPVEPQAEQVKPVREAKPLSEPQADAIQPSEAVETITWEDAGGYIDQEVYVVGRIEGSGQSKTGHVFLNFDRRDRGSLTLFVHSDSVRNFPEPPQQLYRGKLVKVHGFVYDYDGKPNLSVKGPADVTVLPPDTPLPGRDEKARAPVATQPPREGILTLATYNVLNLFDAYDDPYSADSASDRKPRAEIEALARSIQGLNADVLAVQEIENRGYLQRFVNAFLRDMGYEVVAFEGNDNRGIDCAVLSRVPVGPVTSHRHVVFNDPQGRPMRYRRDLLQVTLEPKDAPPLDVYVVHLKSKGGEPEGGADTRMGEGQAIGQVLADRLKSNAQARFVICGDFNDTIDSGPVQAILGPAGSGLVNFLKDLPEDGRVSYNQPPHLSMIDFIFASPAVAAQYVPGSCRIIGGGSPAATGSDHNPVVVQFRTR